MTKNNEILSSLCLHSKNKNYTCVVICCDGNEDFGSLTISSGIIIYVCIYLLDNVTAVKFNGCQAKFLKYYTLSKLNVVKKKIMIFILAIYSKTNVKTILINLCIQSLMIYLFIIYS